MAGKESPIRLEQLAEELNVCVRTVQRWRKRGLPVHKVGRIPFFYWSEVNKWIKENVRESSHSDSG